jgi:hypothetical protein
VRLPMSPSCPVVEGRSGGTDRHIDVRLKCFGNRPQGFSGAGVNYLDLGRQGWIGPVPVDDEFAPVPTYCSVADPRNRFVAPADRLGARPTQIRGGF